MAAIREAAPEIIIQVSTGGAIGMTAHHDLVLGVAGGAAGTPANVTLMSGRLPAGSTWSATGIGRSHLPVIMTAIAAGGHVRLGFEDQVERAARIGEIAGRPVATPERARQILRLAP